MYKNLILSCNLFIQWKLEDTINHSNMGVDNHGSHDINSVLGLFMENNWNRSRKENPTFYL